MVGAIAVGKFFSLVSYFYQSMGVEISKSTTTKASESFLRSPSDYKQRLFQCNLIRKIVKELSDAYEAFQRKKVCGEVMNSSPGSGHCGDDSDDGCGEFHSIQIDHQPDDHDSVPSIEITPPPVLNESFDSNQSDHEQPPPPRSLYDIESQTDSILVGTDFDVSGTAEEGLAALAIRFGFCKSLPPNARILFGSAEICSLIRRIIKELSEDYEAFRRKKIDGEFINSSPGSGHCGESTDDGCGGLHLIQIDYQPADNDSVPSIEMIPPELNKSFDSNQSDHKQPPPPLQPQPQAPPPLQPQSPPQPPPPPPPRSLSHIESQTESILLGTDFNVFSVAKTFLLVAAEEGLAVLAIRFGFWKSLPPNARILFGSAEICSVAGFLSCSCGYILQLVVNRTPQSELVICRKAEPAARLMTGIGGAATACGFLCVVGMLLPESLMLGLTAAMCTIPISAFAFVFWKKK